MKTFTAVLVLISALALNAAAQNQAEYVIRAVKGPYLLIGEKPYKMVSDCPGFDVADKVSFSESPITCETATIVDLLSLAECQVQCLTNEDLPPEYQ